MKHFILIIFSFALLSCSYKTPPNTVPNFDEGSRLYTIPTDSSINKGSSYLSVYSEIYSYTAAKTFPLTITVSIRNTSLKDSIFISKAEYYNTHGELIRSYLSNSIFVKPMESIEVVIDEKDEYGGTGANFYFEWATKNPKLEPHFEAIMISTSGQQGMSFTTQGIRSVE